MDDALRYLLTCGLYGTIAVLVLALVRHFLGKRIPPAGMVLLWILVGLRFLLPAVLPVEELLPRKAVPVPAVVETETYLPPVETVAIPVPESTEPMVTPMEAPAETVPDTSVELPGTLPDSAGAIEPTETKRELVTAVPEPQSEPVPEMEFPWAHILAMLWLTGSAGLTLWFAVQSIRLRWVLRGGKVCEVGGLPPLRRRVTVKKLPGLVSPMTVGILHPLILLPQEEDTDRAVLCHEFCHIRRWDELTKLFVLAVAVVHWWNPAAWLLVRLANRDMELACDRAVLGMTDTDALAYGRILLCYAERRQGLRMGMHFGQSGLKERIDMLLDKRKANPVLCGLLAAGMLFTLVCCGPGVGEDNSALLAALEEETARNAALEAALSEAENVTAELQAQVDGEKEMQAYLRNLLEEKTAEKDTVARGFTEISSLYAQAKEETVLTALQMEYLKDELPYMFLTDDGTLRMSVEDATVAELKAVIQAEGEKIEAVKEIREGLGAMSKAEGAPYHAKEIEQLTEYLTVAEEDLARFEAILAAKQAG